ncbi:MAG: 3-oxoacyl-[acyl-carrier-protein] synthase III C-terminal domain-containing protein [Persicimonas sp.]
MGLELPSRKLGNDDVLAEIAGSGHELGPKAEKSYLQVARKLLEFSGAQTRYWLADDERPVDLLQGAIDEALADADLARDEVDLFIYAAVSRGFLEPAESFTLAKSTGLDPKLWEQFGSDAPDRRARTSILFPHAPSRTLCERFSEESGFPFEKIFQLYTRLGNIGSGSVPMGLYLARQEGRLKRGDQVACLVGAAGMSFMLYDFVF